MSTLKQERAGPPAETLLDTIGQDPWPWYEAMRQRGDVAWDEGAKSWIVTGYDACRTVQLDEERFPRPNAAQADALYLSVMGKRHMTVLSNEEHERMHKWWLRILSPRVVETWRASLVGPIVQQTVARIASRGQAELATDFASRITIRVVAAVLGLPWQDEDWIASCRREMNDIQAFIDNMRFNLDQGIVDRALAATARMNALLDPFIMGRTDGKGEDLISVLWRDGPELLPGWSDDDVRTFARSVFFGGTDTTKDSICGASWLLLSEPGLIARVRDGGRPAVNQFTEEALRLQGPVHLRARVAAVDAEVAGVAVHKGDTLTTLNAAVNRDPKHYGCPHHVDFERKTAMDHFAFSRGPASCVGAPLARIEIQEAVQALVSQFPDLRLDPDQPAPAQKGFAFRSIAPLHVRFTPAAA